MGEVIHLPCCTALAHNLILHGFAYGASGIEQFPDGTWHVNADEHVVLENIQFCPFCGVKLPPC